MVPKVIKYNRKKSLFNIGIGLVILSSIFLSSKFWFFNFITGGSFLYFGFKSFSNKPLFVISEEGLFIGYKIQKQFLWSAIEYISIYKKNADFRKIYFIKVTYLFTTSSRSGKITQELPLENIDIKIDDLYTLFSGYLPQKVKLTK